MRTDFRDGIVPPELTRLEELSPEFALPLVELTGFVTAIACSPTALMPEEWMPDLVRDPEAPVTPRRKEALAALLELFQRIEGDLFEGECKHPTPELEDAALADWCRGFLAGSRSSRGSSTSAARRRAMARSSRTRAATRRATGSTCATSS